MDASRRFAVVCKKSKAAPRLAVLFAALAASCQTTPPPSAPEDPVLLRGEDIFLNETFAGNGRTCGTCHRPEDNFGLSPAFIATLDDNDPLFIAENRAELAQGFENPRLMRSLALILENQDGFDDLTSNFNLRGIPHTLALPTSVASIAGPATGWSADGAPGDGSLRSFAIGAVIQHFPLSTNRIADVDFRLPTDEELDALEAFQNSLGRQEELSLPLPLKDPAAARGQEIFLDRTLGKCDACHLNAGANAADELFGPGSGNLNFNTGVEVLPDQPQDLSGELVPPDDGLGNPGIGEFNTPPLVEAADTAPFFHNNSVATIEGAVAFYNGVEFNQSPAGQLVTGATGSGINLAATQVEQVAAFLRVLNALENIRSTQELLERAGRAGQSSERARTLIGRAAFEAEDAAMVLEGAALHASAGARLRLAEAYLRDAAQSNAFGGLVADAQDELAAAKSEMIE